MLLFSPVTPSVFSILTYSPSVKLCPTIVATSVVAPDSSMLEMLWISSVIAATIMSVVELASIKLPLEVMLATTPIAGSIAIVALIAVTVSLTVPLPAG